MRLHDIIPHYPTVVKDILFALPIIDQSRQFTALEIYIRQLLLRGNLEVLKWCWPIVCVPPVENECENEYAVFYFVFVLPFSFFSFWMPPHASTTYLSLPQMYARGKSAIFYSKENYLQLTAEASISNTERDV